LELCPLEDLDRVALAELDDGLLPPGLRALEGAAALRLRLDLDDVHPLDLHVEELLDGLADLRLVHILVDAERVLVLRDLLIALLRDHRADQHFARMQAHSSRSRHRQSRCLRSLMSSVKPTLMTPSPAPRRARPA